MMLMTYRMFSFLFLGLEFLFYQDDVDDDPNNDANDKGRSRVARSTGVNTNGDGDPLRRYVTFSFKHLSSNTENEKKTVDFQERIETFYGEVVVVVVAGIRKFGRNEDGDLIECEDRCLGRGG